MESCRRRHSQKNSLRPRIANFRAIRLGFLLKTPYWEGLDANQWFDNVELVVAREIGQNTVQYVNNIYKYYVACKLVRQESGSLP